MTLIKQNVSLRTCNTFGIDVNCAYFAEVRSTDEFLSLLKDEVYVKNKKLIIGGGSNVLFISDFNGIVIKNSIKGIEVISEDKETATVKVAAGEVWHDFVMWTIARNFSGVENLSLIPGCVGASPMQNIGAYGVEIKQVFVELEAIDIRTGELKKFNNAACKFGYRESVFKNEYKDRFLITHVVYQLSKKPRVNTSYGAIEAELKARNVVDPSIKDVSEAVIAIRRSKLPNPEEIGNAGSFFKNPEVDGGTFKRLRSEFENLVAYPLEGGRYKLAAGWLIEQCGLKGHEWKGAAVHTKQALVLVNKNNCKGSDVLELSEQVIQSVVRKFGVTLEREVNIVG